MISYNYSQKTVLITGGSSGIGLATAQKFHEAGAKVIILSRSPEKAKNHFSNQEKISLIPVDLNNPGQIQSVFKKLKDVGVFIDIAINAAAANTGIGKPIQSFSEEEYDYTMNVNLKALWLCMKNEIELMTAKQESKCSIINISSVNGLGGVEYGALYAATKAGVIAMTKSAALEQANSHISINAIVPGTFDTPLLKEAMLQQCNGDEEKLEEMKKSYEKHIPKQRIGKPEEIASLIAWMASGEADYLIGHSFIIDGGLSSRFR